MQDEGYIAKILFEEGTKDIPLGRTLAILVDEESDIAAFNDYSEDSAPSQAASTPEVAETPKAADPAPKSQAATPSPA